MYIDKLGEIVDEYNDPCHRTIMVKPIDVKDDDRDPKFKVGDHVRISIYKNIFGKGSTPNWSE